MEIIKKHININYSVGKIIKPQFIVIHETDNERLGADANAHYRFWNSNTSANCSVHYVVDDKRVIQLLNTNERAWHVGDNRGYSKITNDNSIGIEICVNGDGNFERAYHNCTELVAIVMRENKISIENVVRHFDASGKNCPRNIIAMGLWNRFKQEVIDKFNKDLDKNQLSKAQKKNNEQKKESQFNQKTKWIQILVNQLKIKDGQGKTIVEDGILGEKTIYAIKKLPVLKKWCYEAIAVKHIQNLLGITPDGIFGDNTERALRAWQKSKGLYEDGIVGYNTWMSFSV